MHARRKSSRIRDKIANDDFMIRQISKAEFEDIKQFDCKNKNVIRVYLSSTFTDFNNERDYLMENIIPKLKKYCFEKYSYDFYVVDMYWGLADEIFKTNKFVEVCLKEIQDCQKISAGPYFISLLGHKYGTCYLPTSIPENQFKSLHEELQSINNIDLSFTIRKLRINDILTYCYKCDKNEVPFRYKLLEKDILIPGFDIDSKITVDLWNEMSKKLLKLLRQAADNLLRANKLTKDQHQYYFTSLTEEEIKEGIFKSSDAPNKNLVFIREIQNLEKCANDDASLASKYIDMDTDNTLDLETRALLNELKKNIENYLPEKNIHKIKLKWVKEKGIEGEESYLETFGDLFFENLKLLIDQNISMQRKPTHGKIVDELLSHARLSYSYMDDFQSRDTQFETLRNYVLNDNQNPFIVFGDYGTGKSSLLAQLISNASNIFPTSNYSVIYRFLGTTRETTNYFQTLTSIVKQLDRLYDLKLSKMNFDEKEDLKEHLMEQLYKIKKIHPEQKVLIVLDSIEEILDDFNELQLFLGQLPDNTKLILTAVTNPLNQSFLKAKIDLKNYLEMKTLDIRSAITLVELWFQSINRQLTDTQWLCVKKLFVQSHTILTPLYLKVIFSIVSKWPSYHTPDQEFQSLFTVNDCIRHIFDVAEKLNGKAIFLRCIYYLTIFEYGITETELEDILSIDDEILTHVFQFHSPNIRRFPNSYLARIKYDLKDFLIQRDLDNVEVVSWYHEKFYETFLNITNEARNRKSNDSLIINVIDYYNETWNTRPKEFNYSEHMKKKTGLKSSKSFRKTKPQPVTQILTVPNPHNPKQTISKTFFNKRKLNELPNFILKLDESYKILQFFKEYILFDYYFMVAKAKLKDLKFLNKFYQIAILLYENFSQAGSGNNNMNIHLIEDLMVVLYVFTQNRNQIERHPDSLCLHLTSRLAQYSNSTNEIGSLLSEYEKISLANTTLFATYNFLPLDNKFKSTISYQKTSINRLIYCLEEPYVFLLTNKYLYLINYKTQIHLGKLNLKDVLDNVLDMENMEAKIDHYHLSVYDSMGQRDSISSLSDLRRISTQSLTKSTGELSYQELFETNQLDFKIRIAFKSKPSSSNLNITELDGFIVMFYSNVLKIVNFFLELLFEYECTSDIDNVFILSPRHILLFYENCLKIIDINTKTKVYESIFETSIDIVDANFNSYIVYLPEYTKAIDPVIIVTLVNGNIEIYKYIKESTVLYLLCIIQSTGFPILSLECDEKFYIENLYKLKKLKTTPTFEHTDALMVISSNSKYENIVLRFAVLLGNYQLLIYTIDALGIKYSYKVDQITLPQKVRNAMLNTSNIMDFNDKVLFFDCGFQEQSLAVAEKFFMYNIETNKLAQINQNHSFAKIISEFAFVTFNRQEEKIVVWQNSKLSSKSKKMKIIELASFELMNSVSDKSGLLFEYGELIYPSYSALHKLNLNVLCDASGISKELPTDKYDTNIDIKIADNNHMIAATKQKDIGLIDLSDGKLIQKIGKSSFQNLESIECSENVCILISQEQNQEQDLSYLLMNIYIKLKQADNNNYYAEAFKIIGGDIYKVRFHNDPNNTTLKFLIQTYNQATNDIQVYCFLYNEATGDWLDTISKFDLTSNSISSQYSNIRLVFGITCLNNYIIILTYDSDLSIVDYEKNKIIYRKLIDKFNDIDEDNFLNITEVECNDDFIITTKKKCLTQLNHGSVSLFRTIGPAIYVELITAADENIQVNTWSIEGESYLAKKNVFCIQFNKYMSLKFYDLNVCKEHKAFVDAFTKISFTDPTLLYGFSPDCKFFYTFEHENEFNLYDLNNSVCVATLSMHHPVYSINITNQFITMMLDNGTLFSYIIMDPVENKYAKQLEVLANYKKKNFENLPSSQAAIEIYHSETTKNEHSIQNYNRDLFESGGSSRNRKNMKYLADEQSTSELRFRKFIQIKQKNMKEIDLMDCTDSVGLALDRKSLSSTSSAPSSRKASEINDQEESKPKKSCCDSLCRAFKNMFSRTFSKVFQSK